MKTVSFIAPLAVVLAMLVGINCYLAHRSHQCLRFLFPSVPWAVCFGVVALLTLVMVLSFVRSMLPLGPEGKRILAVAGAWCMGIFVYYFLLTVLTDGAVMLYRLFQTDSHRMPLVRFVAGIVTVALTVAVVGYGFSHAKHRKVVTYEVSVPVKKMDREWNIVLISDLHLGAVGSEESLEEMVREINALKPDLICIAGDFFDNDFAAIQNPEAAVKILSRLRPAHGIYACPGNHDSGSTVTQMRQFLADCGIRLLEDESVTIQESLVLLGRLDPSPIGGYDGVKRRPAGEILADVNTELPVVVLDHNPAHIDEYGNAVDLILSGHTHKGQIFPGSLITDRMYTVDYGYYRESPDAPAVVVTSGVGTWGMPMRVGTDCEIVRIRLHS